VRRSGWLSWAISRSASWPGDLGISDVTLRNWLKQEKAQRGERAGGLSQDEREELGRLRDENARLRMEREILSKAAVFFAKESDGR
jgi:transposase